MFDTRQPKLISFSSSPKTQTFSFQLLNAFFSSFRVSFHDDKREEEDINDVDKEKSQSPEGLSRLQQPTPTDFQHQSIYMSPNERGNQLIVGDYNNCFNQSEEDARWTRSFGGGGGRARPPLSPILPDEELSSMLDCYLQQNRNETTTANSNQDFYQCSPGQQSVDSGFSEAQSSVDPVFTGGSSTTDQDLSVIVDQVLDSIESQFPQPEAEAAKTPTALCHGCANLVEEKLETCIFCGAQVSKSNETSGEDSKQIAKKRYVFQKQKRENAFISN